MTTKTISRISFYVAILVLLAACAPAQPNAVDDFGTAIALAQTNIPLTQNALPTATTVIVISPTIYPTRPPIPIITPDAVQVERWKEYEEALAKSIFPTFPNEFILCEWDILKRSEQIVFVWAICAFSKGSDMLPAVIHIDLDGSVQSIEIPKRGSSSNVDSLFPEDVQMKFSLYTGDSVFFGRLKEMLDHLYYRLAHPEEPPLIVLSVMPTSTPTP